MDERRVIDLLRDSRAPDERAAEERGWRVVRAAFEERSPSRPPSSRRARLAIAVAVGILALVIVLTPAGAKVADLVNDVVHPGGRNAHPELTSLPTAGRLLVTSPRTGAWVVAPDGARRRLGSYEDATWSPRGLFVAVTNGRELTAVEPDGTVHWSLSAARPVSDPAWAPSGFRVAYRAGHSIRVVAGDGTEDRLIARHAAPTPAAWVPEANPARNVLSFVGGDDRVRAVDVDSGRTLWRSAPFGGGIESIQSSTTGHVLVIARSFFVILDRHGRPTSKGSTGGRVEAAAFAPDGEAIAIARRANTGSVISLLTPGSTGMAQRRLLLKPGRFSDITWSPDSSWILFGWRTANQWIFLRPADRRITAVSGISHQFAPGVGGPVGFPQVTGWCCAG